MNKSIIKSILCSVSLLVLSQGAWALDSKNIDLAAKQIQVSLIKLKLGQNEGAHEHMTAAQSHLEVAGREMAETVAFAVSQQKLAEGMGLLKNNKPKEASAAADAAMAWRKACCSALGLVSVCLWAKAATKAPTKVSPAPIVLRTGTAKPGACQAPWWVTNKPPSGPSERATSSHHACASHSRATAKRCGMVGSALPTTSSISRKLGLTMKTPARIAAINAGPEASRTTRLSCARASLAMSA